MSPAEGDILWNDSNENAASKARIGAVALSGPVLMELSVQAYSEEIDLMVGYMVG